MKSCLKLFTLICLYLFILSCAGKPVDDEGDDPSLDETEMLSSDEAETSDSSGDSSADASDDPESVDQDLEKEQKVAEGGDPLLDDDPLMDESKKDQTKSDQAQDLSSSNQAQATDQAAQPVVTEETKDPLLDAPPADATPAISNGPTESDFNASNSGTSDLTPTTSTAAEISNIKFEGNEGGGSVVIDGTQPLDYSGRFNSQSHQYVIEIRNAKLPNHLKRPFITKDFQSVVGSIDAFQDPGGDTVKVIVQLREGASEPATHAEGKSIIVVPVGGGAGADSTKMAATNEESSSDSFMNETSSMTGVLNSNNLGQFLSGNMKYYGKKISIEVKDIEVRNAINLIAEESGANLVMSEGVTGSLALKLKNVPWDQALVLILKAKKLGYTRQGNVLRISPISEIKQEEEDAMKLAESRRKIEPLKVQMIPINFSKISDLQTQIKSIITERGSIVADTRTNALIITETEEILDRAKKIISSLDIAPAQVLIEGKLVEARESFDRKVGINWDITGQPLSMGDANMTPNLSIRPSQLGSESLGFNVTLGTLDVLGDLTSILQLEEKEENVKVISSPRIVTLHNEQASITQSATISALVSQGAVPGLGTTRTYKDLTMKMELNVTPEVANNGVVQLKVDITREFLGAIREDGTASPHSRSAKTKVMVKSGQTAVIGGIYQNDGSQLETGVPFLKDIPILGFLFRGRTFHKDKTELLLFLTPRVLSQAGSSNMGDGMSSNSLGQGSNGSSLE